MMVEVPDFIAQVYFNETRQREFESSENNGRAPYLVKVQDRQIEAGTARTILRRTGKGDDLLAEELLYRC